MLSMFLSRRMALLKVHFDNFLRDYTKLVSS